MHLIVYFYGTGSPIGTLEEKASNAHGLGQNIQEIPEYTLMSGYPNIATINIYGCTHPEVCNAFLFPNLRKFAKRFVEKLFSNNDQKTTLATAELTSLRIGVDGEKISLPSNAESSEIESITLVGFSRGAVTCFNVAQELNQVAPHIPVNIVAAEPVPGNLYAFPGSNTASIADCTALGNLKNVSVIIGAHSTEDNVFIQNAFFSQIVPKLPESAQRNVILTPAATHEDTSGMTGILVQVELAKCLNNQNALGKEGKEHVEILERRYEATYQNVYEDQLPKKRKLHFPLAQKMQKVFGIDRETLLKKHKEKEHPNPLLSSGYELQEKETLLHWWRKHDRKILVPPSNLTKSLIKDIKDCNKNNPTKVFDLFNKVDQWLLKKAFTSSSRYENVLQLRNVLYDRLIKELNYSKEELHSASLQNQQETNYVATKWQNLILATGPLSREEKKSLAGIFAEHAKTSPSFEREQSLMSKIGTWAEKQDSSKNPKLADTVQLFREELQKMATALYPKPDQSLDSSQTKLTQSKND